MSEKPEKAPWITVLESTVEYVEYNGASLTLTPMNSFTPEEWKLEKPVWASSPFLVSPPLRIRNGTTLAR